MTPDLIAFQLEQIQARLASIENKVDVLQTEVAGLKVKASVWGAGAGLLAVLTTLGIQFLGK